MSRIADLSLDRHILQKIVRKAVKPWQRRELGQWTRQCTRAARGGCEGR